MAKEPSEGVTLRDGKLVWCGALPAQLTTLDVTYSAVGTVQQLAGTTFIAYAISFVLYRKRSRSILCTYYTALIHAVGLQ